MEASFTFEESVTAFILIFAASCLIYLLGRCLSPKPAQSGDERSTYACGEKEIFQRLRINVSLYRYLIYFVILDSSVLLVAFASLMMRMVNMILFTFYLAIMLASTLLLLEGGKE
jgi:NADH:ubiquinone oxidoreductase subunit 3 (subunit A)